MTTTGTKYDQALQANKAAYERAIKILGSDAVSELLNVARLDRDTQILECFANQQAKTEPVNECSTRPAETVAAKPDHVTQDQLEDAIDVILRALDERGLRATARAQFEYVIGLLLHKRFINL
ncbi:hypothetical protein [Dongia sp.]|uniref:hypothetical protein n=1 Tax=Dongia sp. TaxID=1977262 RepID=UPI0035B43980